MVRKLLLAALVSAVTAVPQQQRKTAAPKTPASKAETSRPPVEFPIERVRVEGSKLYPEDKLIAATGLKVGEPGVPKAFEAARDRLSATGAFESVAYRYEPGPDKKGYVVTFEVADIQQVYPLRFERLPLPEAELRSVLRQALPLFTDRVPGTKETIDLARRAVEDYLKSKGHNDPLSARVVSERPGDLYVSIHPAAAPPVVAEVTFKGNEVIPTTVLQNTIHGVAIGVEYRESRFRELLDTSIRPLYEQRGRVAVAFPKIEATPSQGVKGLKISVEVAEGETYLFDSLRVIGTQNLDEELTKVANVKLGDLANMDQVAAAQERIHAAMRRNGYMRVSSKPERAIDSRKKTVSVTIDVTPGPQFTFGKLDIQGLDLHGASEVKRIWTAQAGKPFNADYPDYFLNRIREDGVFENLGVTRAVLQPNDANLTVDVTLIFKAPEKKQEQKVPF
jgi:outer membrane protein insertion porin family